MIISVRPLYLVAGLVAALLAGACATTYWLTVEPTPTKIQENVHPGDKVVINTKAGTAYRLKVTQVTSEVLIGTSVSDAEKEVTIPFEQIEAIQLEAIARAPQSETTRAMMKDSAKSSALFLLLLLVVLVLAG